MSRWRDPLTEATYELDDSGVRNVRHHLAAVLRAYLDEAGTSARAGGAGVVQGRLKHLADGVASFWSDHYPQLIFPLRIAANPERPQEAYTQGLDPDAAGSGRLPADGPWRSRYLQPGLPPILPADALGVGAHETLLASDWALAASAFVLCAWRSRFAGSRDGTGSPSSEDDLSALRLAVLLFPLWEALPPAGGLLAEAAAYHRVRSVAGALADPSGPAAEEWREIAAALRHPDTAPAWVREPGARVVVGGAQRIKQYVFESPQLPQIRGGSILIEQALAAAAQKVARELGPECVVRKAGGSLALIVPATDPEDLWTTEIARLFHQYTGTARFATGSAEVPFSALLPLAESSAFAQGQRLAYGAQNLARDTAEEPRWETLPFEERCDTCGERAAEAYEPSPEGEPRRLCAVCLQRLRVGRRERKSQIEQVWRDVGIEPDGWIEREGDGVPPSLEELVPEGRRRRWIAMAYGDGNNFGGIVQRLKSLPEHLHWTRRLYWTVRGLTEMALVGATTTFAHPERRPADSAGPELPEPVQAELRYYPFEVLAIGGDDVAFFAWAPVGLKAVERLQAGLEAEFAPTAAGAGPGLSNQPARQASDGRRPITFSFGVVIGDHHTPVRRLREVAEEVLLKKVKGMQSQTGPRGQVAFFVAANSSEVTPSRVEQLWRMERGGADDRPRILLSVQPLSAEQLAFLLEKAASLTGEVGRLSRLTTPFILADPEVALLNYRYSRARARLGRAQERDVFSLLEEDTSGGAGWALFADAKRPSLFPKLDGRPSPGSVGPSDQGSLPRVPLVDLLQLVKVLQ